MNMKKSIFILLVLFIMNIFLVGSWNKSVVFSNNDKTLWGLSLSYLYNKNSNELDLIMTKFKPGCMANWISKSYFKQKNYKGWKSEIVFPGNNVKFSLVEKDSLGNVEVFFMPAPRAGLTLTKKIYYTKFSKNQFTNPVPIYSPPDSEVFLIDPIAIFKDRFGKRYFFIEIMKGEFAEISECSLYYLIQEGLSWKGPYRVISAPNLVECSSCVYNNKIHFVWNEVLFLEDYTKYLKTCYVNFDGKSWSKKEKIPVNFPCSFALNFYNNNPFFTYVTSIDKINCTYGYTARKNGSWEPPRYIEMNKFPEDIQYQELQIGDPLKAVEIGDALHVVFSVGELFAGNGGGLLYGRYNGEWSKLTFITKANQLNYAIQSAWTQIFKDSNSIPNIVTTEYIYKDWKTLDRSDIVHASYSPILPPSKIEVRHELSDPKLSYKFVDYLKIYKNNNNDDQEIDHYNIYVQELSSKDFKLLKELDKNEDLNFINENVSNPFNNYGTSIMDIYGKESTMLVYINSREK